MCCDAGPRALLLVVMGVLFLCGRAVPLGPPEEEEDEEGAPDREEVQAELANIKQRLLANLGLSRVPDVSRANVSASEMARVMSVYRRSVAQSMEEEEEDQNEDEEDERDIHRFYSYRDSAPINRTSSWQHLYFPLSISNRRDESHRRLTIHSAKLHLSRLCKGQMARASLYQLLEPWDGTESADRILVEERKLSRTKKGSKSRGTWGRNRDAVFELSRPVSSWLENPALNYGLLLRCTGAVRSRHRQHTGSRAVLDVLVKERPTRQKRSDAFQFQKLRGRHVRKDCTSSNKTNLCCRYSLEVSFKDIGWNYIIKPEKFQAHFCRGKCIKGMSNFNSNHAQIQSIVNSIGKDVPRPCCAPKKLGMLSVMHYNDKHPIEPIVTEMKGMIVKSCGCS